jgi:hypothetical protein
MVSEKSLRITLKAKNSVMNIKLLPMDNWLVLVLDLIRKETPLAVLIKPWAVLNKSAAYW